MILKEGLEPFGLAPLGSRERKIPFPPNNLTHAEGIFHLT